MLETELEAKQVKLAQACSTLFVWQRRLDKLEAADDVTY